MALPSLLAAPPFLWEVLDDYLVDLLTDWKDQWLETAPATVVAAETFDPDSATMPAVVLSSYGKEGGGDETPFGDGQYHISGIGYIYEIYICASFADVFNAKRFASAAAASVSDFLRDDLENIVALNGANGEAVMTLEFGDVELYVRGLAGQPIEGTYTGCAVVEFTVKTEI